MSNSSTDQPNIQLLWMEWSFDDYYLMFAEAGESSSPASAGCPFIFLTGTLPPLRQLL